MGTNGKMRLWIILVVVLVTVTQNMAAYGPLPPDRHEPAIIYVDAYYGNDNRGGFSLDRPFATISKAISVAIDGDIVFVYPGIYRETLDLAGKAITIRGIAGPQGIPVIEAPRWAAVLIAAGEGPDTVLQNLVIRKNPIGVCTLKSSPTLLNLTVVDCGIGAAVLGDPQPVINSCIFWNNTLSDTSGAQARYSCIQRPDEAGSLYNISKDPQFADLAGGDYHLKSRQGRYLPELNMWWLDDVTSSCINAGDPNMDYSLEPVPNGERLNMGAYGGSFFASKNSNLSPSVHMVAYGSNSTISSMGIRIEAIADDPDGVVLKVEFFANGIKAAEDTNGADGWSADCQVEKEGIYEINVVAEDDEGLRSISETGEVNVRRYSPPSR